MGSRVTVGRSIAATEQYFSWESRTARSSCA